MIDTLVALLELIQDVESDLIIRAACEKVLIILRNQRIEAGYYASVAAKYLVNRVDTVLTIEADDFVATTRH